MLGDGALEASEGARPQAVEAAERFHVAVVLRRVQLEAAYDGYLNYFGGAKGAVGYGHLLEAMDAGVLPAAAAASLPPPQFIKDAVRMTRELEALDRIASRGPFADLQRVLHTAREQASNAPENTTAV